MDCITTRIWRTRSRVKTIGVGVSNSISGVATIYAAGGAGSHQSGGAGANGTDGLGNGAKGGGSGGPWGTGGSGIVIIRYKS